MNLTIATARMSQSKLQKRPTIDVPPVLLFIVCRVLERAGNAVDAHPVPSMEELGLVTPEERTPFKGGETAGLQRMAKHMEKKVRGLPIIRASICTCISK